MRGYRNFHEGGGGGGGGGPTKMVIFGHRRGGSTPPPPKKKKKKKKKIPKLPFLGIFFKFPLDPRMLFNYIYMLI